MSAVDKIIPWDRWRGIETTLRIYLTQIWFNLSDVGVEDAIHDSYAMRKFMGIDFLSEQVPNSTTQRQPMSMT